jgi:hypothetical protein
LPVTKCRRSERPIAVPFGFPPPVTRDGGEKVNTDPIELPDDFDDGEEIPPPDRFTYCQRTNDDLTVVVQMNDVRSMRRATEIVNAAWEAVGGTWLQPWTPISFRTNSSGNGSVVDRCQPVGPVLLPAFDG